MESKHDGALSDVAKRFRIAPGSSCCLIQIWPCSEVPTSIGSGPLGSGIAMDKDVTKRLLRDAGLPIEVGTPLGEAVLVVDGEEVDRTPLLAEFLRGSGRGIAR